MEVILPRNTKRTFQYKLRANSHEIRERLFSLLAPVWRHEVWWNRFFQYVVTPVPSTWLWGIIKHLIKPSSRQAMNIGKLTILRRPRIRLWRISYWRSTSTDIPLITKRSSLSSNSALYSIINFGPIDRPQSKSVIC